MLILEKIFPMWNFIEEQFLEKFSGKISREDYFKKVILYKDGKHNIDIMKAKLKPEVVKYDDEQLAMYSGLMLAMDAIDYYLTNWGFPNKIDNIDNFIEECVLLKNNPEKKIVKVMSDDIFLNLYPSKIGKASAIQYSPLEIFEKYGVFSSVYTPKEVFLLDRTKYDAVCCLEDNLHLDDFLEFPLNATVSRLLNHFRYLAIKGQLEFNVSYVQPSYWKKVKGGIELAPKFNNKIIFIANKALHKVESDLSNFYSCKVQINHFCHTLHLLDNQC